MHLAQCIIVFAYNRGLLALLVLDDRARPRPQKVGRVICKIPRFLFLYGLIIKREKTFAFWGWQKKLDCNMKSVFYFTLLVCFFVCACDKEYKYVPYDKNANVIKEVSIKAPTDSAAYNDALVRYVGDIGTSMILPHLMEYPLGFYLKDSHNKIVPIEEKKREQWTNYVLNRLLGDDAPKIDYEKNMQLLQYFDMTTDASDKDGTTWYQPNSRFTCRDNKRLSVYLYFGENKKKLAPLRIKFCYTQNIRDSWLNIQKMVFNVNGKLIEYIPDRVKSDASNSYSTKTEIIDEAISAPTIKLINALLTSNSVEVKIIGRNETIVKSLCDNDIESIRRTVEFYKAMGGFFITDMSKYEK